MRCPDCNKFVSMENEDPEIDFSATLDASIINVTVDSGRHVRKCADCGTELKEISLEGDATLDVTCMDSYMQLSPEDKALVDTALAEGEAEVEVETSETYVDESGGGRYKKNEISITATADVTVTVSVEGRESDIVLGGVVDVTFENSAGSYEECC